MGYVESLGLTAGPCLEQICRQQLGLDGPIDFDGYTDIILGIKNQIGGNFSRASGDPGMVRVVNSRCPFGTTVQNAPELCRMTASVFGGIAARNFGYAKVDLRRRIAVGDSHCEVCIHVDPTRSADIEGDEYRYEEGVLVSRPRSGKARVQATAHAAQTWCATTSAEQPRTDARGQQIVAESAAMQRAIDVAELVAPTLATVLISGETGVGKEVIARLVHTLSDRNAHELVAVNCGAIPQELIESALFGHEKGAFTGAYDVHHGYFERAEGGTLFLDEIDSLPISAQAKLLRVLQGNEFERVGGRHTMRANVRIVAASNQELADRVAAGQFRQDLYYRLNVVPIVIPPLRDRRDDLTALTQSFLRRLAARYGGTRKILGERAWTQMMVHPWPGNVRELENVLERSFLFSRGRVIESLALDGQPARRRSQGAAQVVSLRDVTKQAAMHTEGQLIRLALEENGGNVSAVARQIGISPRAVHQKLKKHGIDPQRFRVGRD
ncbi:sigma-54 dependent transcriptional regulator [Thioalkalivibrio nitratireducens DSM 14787]|uniref:Sigma-54 dependent transcriptional regulator n=1 Tax=Thioalkalivibrio nitratireducens (strain DSM 14787 / UNIQEM 213 / ALEN2) TaxID=1255043 RepID=L0DZY4_THIND|nr:sigma-54 dependent transcriptional regulator [Thioalkalivibrio nitratireducens DSM 14787]